jgi:hypothetical protein
MSETRGKELAVITERDESLHTQGTEMPERWQENMMFIGWDLDQEVGFYFHVQRIPHTGFTELKAVVCDAAGGVSGRVVVPMPERVMYEGLVIEEPFRRARLSFSGAGVPLDSPAALPALSDSGSVPYSIDLRLMGLSGPADWFEPLSAMAATESNHYQVAGSFEGALGYDTKTLDATGLFWRDHTWGLRNYVPDEYEVSDGRGGLHSSWFTPVVLDGGCTLVNGLWIRMIDGQHQQFVVLSEGERTSYFDDYAVEVLSGSQEICRYDSVRITGGNEQTPIDCRIDVQRHLPMWLPEHGPNSVLSEAFGPARWGEKTGWGSAELMETLPVWRQRPEFAAQLAAV